MYRGLIVNLNIDPNTARDSAADYAISLAQLIGAHLMATAFGRALFIVAPVLPPTMQLLDAENRAREEQAAAAADRFKHLAHRHGVDAEAQSTCSTTGDSASAFSALARCHDLAIVGQPSDQPVSPEDVFFEAALIDSGRPVIVVPFTHTGPARLGRIMCCWDGTRESARAIGDSLCLLRVAENVLLYSAHVTPHNLINPSDMLAHLSRHGIEAEHDKSSVIIEDVPSAILARASDFCADLIVMGGYGHSRLREFILGGVTRSILDTTTVPVMFAH